MSAGGSNREITRSPGVAVGAGLMPGFVVGSGFKGATADLDETVQRAAEVLRDAYDMPVTIRFNSDRMSGGAWLHTDEPDAIGLNAEVGICAALVTEEGNRRFAERYPDMAGKARDPGIYILAHVGKRVGEYAHEQVASIEDALSYVQSHADLSRLVHRPVDPKGDHMTNEQRAERAYRRALGYSEDGIENDITDLLCDLLHLADQYEGADEMLQRAQSNYRFEITEPV